MSIDTQTIKASVDLLALAGPGLRKVASGTRGPEYAGPCPKCGGRDRFRVQPEAGAWFCRQCHPEWGDAIELVKWRDGLGFREACERLGDKQRIATNSNTLGRSGGAEDTGKYRKIQVLGRSGGGQTLTKPYFEPTPDAPPELWQSRAADFLSWTQAELWKHPDALAHLYSRGLRADTVLSAGMGFNPKTLHDKGTRWGYDTGRQWLPSGYVIPCQMGGRDRKSVV